MAETTKLDKLVLNVLTKEQFDGATKEANQLYLIKDETPPGDMLKSTYDPQGKNQDAFAYADTAATGAVTTANGYTDDNIEDTLFYVEEIFNNHSGDATAHDDIRQAVAGKQDQITGTQGQIVGFDENGKPVAQAAPATGVTSFKGRTGAVTPQSGDYTATMVGARPDTWTPTASDVGAAPTARKVNNKALSADITLTAADVKARADTWMPTPAEVGAVPTNRKVNNNALSSDITLSASDVKARPDTWMPSAQDVGAVPTTRTVNNKPLSSNISLNASDVGAVPTGRTINNKLLSSDVTLNASDVGARPNTWTPTAADVGADSAGTAESKANAAVSTANSYTDNAIQNIPDLVKTAGGATLNIDAQLGTGPHTIEFTEEEESFGASNVVFDNTGTSIASTDVQSAIVELFTDVSEGKSLIAAAVTDKGVQSAATDSFQVMADKISTITTGTPPTAGRILFTDLDGVVTECTIYTSAGLAGNYASMPTYNNVEQTNSDNGIYFAYIENGDDCHTVYSNVVDGDCFQESSW